MANHNGGGDHPAVQTPTTKYSVSSSNIGLINVAILALLSLVTMFKRDVNPDNDPENRTDGITWLGNEMKNNITTWYTDGSYHRKQAPKVSAAG